MPGVEEHWTKTGVIMNTFARTRSITTIIVLSLLAGSVAGQKKDQRPAVDTPDRFRGIDTQAPVDQTSIGDLKWFEVFKDPELQQLVRTAMQQNYDLRTAVARIDASGWIDYLELAKWRGRWVIVNVLWELKGQ